MLKYSGVFKIILCLFLTVGCNLSIEGHFWPDDILPYVFLVFSAFAVSRMDLDGLTSWILNGRTKLYIGLLMAFSIVLQSIILRIYLVDSMTVFIKAGIKVLIAGLTTAFMLTLCLFRVLRRPEGKERPDIMFDLFSLAGIIYFYAIRRTTDNFSIYPFLLFMLVYLAKADTEIVADTEAVSDTGDRSNIIIKTGAVFLALFETLGYLAITYWDYHGGLLKWLCLALIGTSVWIFIFYYILRAIFIMIDNIALETGKKNDITGKAIVRAALSAALGIRLIYWLNWFPALLSKDTYVQIQQALGIEPYSNHHPWLHTMIIKFFMGIGKLIFGSNQAGVAVVAFASLLISSLLLAAILRYYYGNVPSPVWLLAALIFVAEPIHCVYSVTIWKDVLFAYALLAFCFLLMVMDGQIEQQGRLKPYMWLLYVAVSFIFCFSRTNGLYAWLFTLPFLLWHYRKALKPWIISTLACLLLIAGYKGFLLPHFQVTEPDMVEALSVPLQQIAFTVKNGGDFSGYDTSVISNIVAMDSMGEYYNPHISDPVKNLIRQYGNQDYITQNKLEFIKMYVSVGVKNPLDYIVAFLYQSRGYWHQKMSNYIYFSEGVHRFAAELNIYRTPLFPPSVSALADKLMDKYCDIWHTLWSLALSTYVVWILFVYALSRKRAGFYFLPIIGVFITLVIATPVNDEFRYAYGIYLALPLLLMQTAVCPEQPSAYHNELDS